MDSTIENKEDGNFVLSLTSAQFKEVLENKTQYQHLKAKASKRRMQLHIEIEGDGDNFIRSLELEPGDLIGLSDGVFAVTKHCELIEYLGECEDEGLRIYKLENGNIVDSSDVVVRDLFGYE